MARIGQEVASAHSVNVQLAGQEAKALGRVGDVDGVRSALDKGAMLLSSLPHNERPEHHFVVDPDKWGFYAMDAYRLAGDGDQAATHAHEIIARGTLPDGGERWPMRMAEARLTLGVVAAQSGQLEQAIHDAEQALQTARRSLPSLMMVAGELDSLLHERYPGEPATREFRERLRQVS
jgi:hypothetical protein